jgi:hypothetical protein
MRWPFQSNDATESEIDCPNERSSGSWSITVSPRSTVPSRVVTPAWKSIASAKLVLPLPLCPSSTTFLI